MAQFIPALSLSQCEQCNNKAAEVVESRRSAGYVRRRKRCRHCEHRFTDYELSAAEFQRLQAAATALASIRKALGAEQPAPAPVAEPAIICDQCEFKTRGGCSFGYPEYGTEDARDCVCYEPGS